MKDRKYFSFKSIPLVLLSLVVIVYASYERNSYGAASMPLILGAIFSYFYILKFIKDVIDEVKFNKEKEKEKRK